MTAVLLAFAGLFGLLIGSFLNVVIYRVPAGLSVVRPRSRCGTCGTEIAPRDNVPVLSWLLLRGRCRHCGTRISPRYPLVELLTGAMFVAFAARFGFAWVLLAFLYLAAVCIALAFIDLDTKRLPNALTFPSYVVGVVLLAIPAAITHDWTAFVRALLGMAALYAFFFLLWFVAPGGMGFGDVKLSGVLGLYLGWLGWGPLAVGAFLSFVYGAVVGIVLMILQRAGRKTKVPFGPFLVLGTFTAVFVGAPIANAYLHSLAG